MPRPVRECPKTLSQASTDTSAEKERTSEDTADKENLQPTLQEGQEAALALKNLVIPLVQLKK